MARQCLLFILTRRDVGVHDVETADFRDILGIARIIQKEPPRSEPSSSGLDILQSPSIPLPPKASPIGSPHQTFKSLWMAYRLSPSFGHYN